MDENIQGKYFSITDPENVNTVIYQVNRTDREYANSPKFTVERLDFTEEFIGAKKKKTFYVDNPEPDGNPLVIMSFSKERVVINIGLLDYDVVKISKKPMPVKFTTVFTENEGEFKEFSYTPNMKRPISIIDPETGDEVKPTLYFDEEANEVKGKCKLKPYKKYFAFEIREKK